MDQKENQKVLRQFLFLPLILGILLFITGLFGIYASRQSAYFTQRLNDTALGPTFAFEEISTNLHELGKDLLRVNQTSDPAAQADVKARIGKLADKITRQVQRQVDTNSNTAYAEYLSNWARQWRALHESIMQGEPAQISALDHQLSELNEKMSNIDTFIQADVQDILDQSTRFSRHALMYLITTLVLGLLIGAAFSVVIVKSIRRLFLIIAESRRNIHNLLDNLDQGFFVFDSSYKILPEISKAARQFFGEQLAGREIQTILPLEPRHQASFASWKTMAFEQALSFGALLPLAPKSLEIQDRYIELDFRPIYEGEKLSSIICIGSDKTEERNLRRRAELEALLVKLAMTILTNRRSFIEFVLMCRKTCKNLTENLSAAADQEIILRDLHTLKGNCATFHMTQFADDVHQLETFAADRSAGDSLKERVGEFHAKFERFLQQHEYLLGRIDESVERTKTFPLSTIIRQYQLIEREIGRESAVFTNFVEHFLQDNVAHLFARYQEVVALVAERQNKPSTLEISETTLRLFTEPYQSLVNSFVHVFRNAIAHGIEETEVREAQGKSPLGRLKISFSSVVREQSEFLRIEVQDDGRGINPKVIRVRAERLGLFTPGEDNLSDEQVLQLVFRSGFTTSEEASEIAGRGVGLNAVQFEAQALGGQAKVETKLGEFTRIIVEVPYFRSVTGESVHAASPMRLVA